MQDQKTAYLSLSNGEEPVLCELVQSPMEHHKRSLSYTATGYGSKIPTENKLKYNGRLYRVYCAVFSNIGTCYIVVNGKKCVIN